MEERNILHVIGANRPARFHRFPLGSLLFLTFSALGIVMSLPVDLDVIKNP